MSERQERPGFGFDAGKGWRKVRGVRRWWSMDGEGQ